MNSSNLGRALQALRKNRRGGVPPIKPGTPEEMEKRRKAREAVQRFRARKKAEE